MRNSKALLLTTLCFLLGSCGADLNESNLEERATVRLAGQVYGVPFEYNPSADDFIANDLRDLQRGGVAVVGNPLDAQHMLFRTIGGERAGVISVGIQIRELQDTSRSERQLKKEVNVESVESISVAGPIPGDDDPNSIHRRYELSADFHFADGSTKSVPFRCQGADGFDEVEGQTLFGCKLGLITDDKTGVLLRLGPYEDLDLIRKDISFALSCLLTLRDVAQECR